MGYDIKTTDEFDAWFAALGRKDRKAHAKVLVALERAEDGNFGDHHTVGGGVSEMRINYGPGYRVYYTVRKRVVVIVLAGGDKSTQPRDIKRAHLIAKEFDG